MTDLIYDELRRLERSGRGMADMTVIEPNMTEGGNGTMAEKDFDLRLSQYLKKCEIEYCAKKSENGRCISWIAPYCNNLNEIVCFLKEIGFMIKRIVDEEPWPGEVHKWVETTNGVIVYQNNDNLRGFVGRAN